MSYMGGGNVRGGTVRGGNVRGGGSVQGGNCPTPAFFSLHLRCFDTVDCLAAVVGQHEGVRSPIIFKFYPNNGTPNGPAVKLAGKLKECIDVILYRTL